MTAIADAIRVVAERVRQTEAMELRRLAAMVQRLEERLDEYATDGQADAHVPREGNVVAFKRR